MNIAGWSNKLLISVRTLLKAALGTDIKIISASLIASANSKVALILGDRVIHRLLFHLQNRNCFYGCY